MKSNAAFAILLLAMVEQELINENPATKEFIERYQNEEVTEQWTDGEHEVTENIRAYVENQLAYNDGLSDEAREKLQAVITDKEVEAEAEELVEEAGEEAVVEKSGEH
jgi:hypothetical protein